MQRAEEFDALASNERRNGNLPLATLLLKQGNFWLKYAKNLLDNVVVK
jgi:hypothetical protein